MEFILSLLKDHSLIHSTIALSLVSYDLNKLLIGLLTFHFASGLKQPASYPY